MKTRMRDLGLKVISSGCAFYVAVQGQLASIRCNAFDDAEKAVSSLQGNLIKLAEVLFPLAIVICAISMFFTRDSKKFDLEKHILIGCCLAFALVMLVQKGNVVQTIQDLVNGVGAATTP